MNRPDKVRVGAAEIEVIWEDNAWFRSANATAQFDPIKQTIRVYDEGCPGVIACRFAHEIAHAIIWYHEFAADGSLTEERAADLASYGMADFWKSNPEVFKWWCGLLGLVYKQCST